SLNRLIRCVCGKKIGPDPRNFNQRVSLGRNDLLIRTFPSSGWQSRDGFQKEEELGSPLVGSLTAAACHSLQSPGKHAISFFSVGYMAYSASYLGNPED
ncbi:hypothetical protein, partial [Escherichia coli]|uniref:hypothetical protein n=1 Tax=Escherichia coli TaxID=562 RepID=UPI001A7E0B01